ncbi:hypothetical protein NMG60_11003269 [Bertholletia excelsa]
MPRSRGSEMPQKLSPGCRAPIQLRTSSSGSDPTHRRSSIERGTKPGDRRSPRGAQTDPLNQKKLGTRIADLESQLVLAQEELKVLKEQLTSVEAAKKEAQQQLEKKTLKKPSTSDLEDEKTPTGDPESNPDDNGDARHTSDDIQPETDVFEVPTKKATVEPKIEMDEENHETKPTSISTKPPALMEPPKPTFEESALKSDEINSLKLKLEEKDKELDDCRRHNESLKGQLDEAGLEISTIRAKEEEVTSKLTQLGQELEARRANEVKLKEKVEAVEGAKEELEAEMKKLRIQTEQWRKAADAAAAVLAGGAEGNGGRVSGRCGSLDKHYGGLFGPPVGGYARYVGSPDLADDSDGGFGSGKRKGSGIRKFGELWKKKGQK